MAGHDRCVLVPLDGLDCGQGADGAGPIQARIDALRADPDFQARLRDHLERNREILEGLAST